MRFKTSSPFRIHSQPLSENVDERLVILDLASCCDVIRQELEHSRAWSIRSSQAERRYFTKFILRLVNLELI